MAGDSFFSELSKRRVFRAAAIYGAVAWGLTEVIVTVVEQLFLPAWVATLSVIVFVVGFPAAMFLAWTFDITAEGIQRTDIRSRRGAASIAGSLALLVAGTAGLFLLIRPAMEQAERGIAGASLAPHSVAVLPFENTSRRDDDYYLSEGLGDELRDQLSRVQGLRIAARSSSVAIRNQAVGAAKMAATLGVAYLVEGSLRRNGPRLNISVQLIDGSSGLAVWSDHYERSALELIDVQQDIARQVVTLVLPDAPGTQLAAPATLNPSANDLLLLARHKENQVRERQIRDDETLLEAIRLYRQATETDPASALAHSRLAGALLYLGDIEAAEAAIFTALSLDPKLSEVQNTLGEFYWASGQPEAEAAFEKAIELNPYNADALHNLSILIMLMPEQVEADDDSPADLLRRALEVDPLSLARHAALGEHLGLFGDWEAIPPVIEKVKTLFSGPEAYYLIGWLYELQGQLDQSVAWILKARQLEPGNPDHNAKLAELFALMGDPDTARRLEPEPSVGLLFQLRDYDALIDVAEFRIIEESDDIDARYLLAFAYLVNDRFDQAIHVLSSTGLPDSMINGLTRSVSEIEAFSTLVAALQASGVPEAQEAARSLVVYQESLVWWGDIAWQAIFRSCNLEILGERQKVLALIPRIKESPRLRRPAFLHDAWWFRSYQNEPAYLDVLKDQNARRATLRARLPATLAEHGVSL